MEISKIINTIENFAPLESQSSWDCSGWVINNGKNDVKKILLAITVDEKIIDQAIQKGCDLIISHHPLFLVPLRYQKGVQLYSAHTNLDVAKGGTTDSLISLLELTSSSTIGEFLRVVELDKEISVKDFISLIKSKLNLDLVRVVNKSNLDKIKKIAFCAGSGADFLEEVQSINADVFVTGDIKFHTAFDSDIVLIDVGHFESERPVLNTVKDLFNPLDVEVIIADEKSPFTLC